MDRSVEKLFESVNDERYESALDWLTTENFWEVGLSSSRRLSLLYAANKFLNGHSSVGSGGGLRAKLRASALAVQRRPSALVKVVRSGGTSSARGLQEQMMYLEKDGTVALERSDRYFGAEISGLEQEQLVDAWGLASENRGGADRTTHIIVSFPHNTPPDAAYRAGRAWANEMFASGKYGDIYDYYTAFHTDRQHPHIHVVVNRRGLENGDWLKISRESAFNYDEFRHVQVEMAAREGIHLSASPRYARGLTDRPVPDAEVRRAQEENREPQPPAHTPVTAVRAVLESKLFAESLHVDANLTKSYDKALSNQMRDIADALKFGHAVRDEIQAAPVIPIEDVYKLSEVLVSKRAIILNRFDEVQNRLDQLPESPEKSEAELQAAQLFADAEKALPDVPRLQAYRSQASDNYRGIRVTDDFSRDIQKRVQGKAAEIARETGFDPETMIVRFSRTGIASVIADRWRQSEIDDLAQNRNITQEQATSQRDDAHGRISALYKEAGREIAAHNARKAQALHTLGRDRQKHEVNEQWTKNVDKSLTDQARHRLFNGDPSAFRDFTVGEDAQRQLARRYLETKASDPSGVEQIRAREALARLDRGQNTRRTLEQQRQHQQRARSRDVDREL